MPRVRWDLEPVASGSVPACRHSRRSMHPPFASPVLSANWWSASIGTFWRGSDQGGGVIGAAAAIIFQASATSAASAGGGITSRFGIARKARASCSTG